MSTAAINIMSHSSFVRIVARREDPLQVHANTGTRANRVSTMWLSKSLSMCGLRQCTEAFVLLTRVSISVLARPLPVERSFSRRSVYIEHVVVSRLHPPSAAVSSRTCAPIEASP
jgi:hypothetical protein